MKRGEADPLHVIVTAVIVLVVVVVVIMIFTGQIRLGANTARGVIDDLADCDGDGVPNLYDKCCDKSAGVVELNGCIPGTQPSNYRKCEAADCVDN